MNIVPAEIANSQVPVEATPLAEAVAAQPASLVSDQTNQPVEVNIVSWPFRIIGFCNWLVSRVFGVGCAVFFLALAASIPVVQFISLGYLFEVTGRVGRSGRLRDGFVDLGKASKMGRVVLGTWLCLLPIQIVSGMWYSAWLIDPTSQQASGLRILQVVLVVLTIPHILAAWFCGGRLRHFFWPLIAPFSLALWGARNLLAIPAVKQTVDSFTSWAAPGFAEDIAAVRSIENWFLPAVLIKNLFNGKLFIEARDKLWNFLVSLNLPYYFVLGFKGFVGSFCWLFGPTMLLIGSTMLVSDARLSTDEIAGISALLAFAALLLCSPVFAVLPAFQAHFAAERRLACFCEFAEAFKIIRGAPLLYLTTVFLIFLLAVPLFLFDIERVPNQLIWSLVIVFMVLIWPGKILLGWTYGKGAKRDKPKAWWYSIPVIMLTTPVAFAYGFLLFFTRYTSWNGTWSMLENEVFLLPSPFWLM